MKSSFPKIFLILIFCTILSVYSNLFKMTDEMAAQINQLLANIKSTNYTNYTETPDVNISNPKISVVIPVYNEEKYIKNAFVSIQNQSFKQIEIIFIDDASTDKTPQILSKFKKVDKRVRIIRNRFNRGILFNRIYGALKSRGEYVMFLDADDVFINMQIMSMCYNTSIKNDLDLIQFEYFGGRYDGKDGFNTFLSTSLFDKSRYNRKFYQPEIVGNFFYSQNYMNLLSAIVYDKFYSRKLIQRMADNIQPKNWNQHSIYMEDFIICLAAARNAESFMIIPFGGVWHWYENPEGMTNQVFEMKGKKLKFPDQTNKKLGDYLGIWEMAFDMTEDDPNAEHFRVSIMKLLAQPDNRHVFAQTYHFDRILNICRRFFKWKYVTPDTKKIIAKFARDTIKYAVSFESKYDEFYEDDKKSNEKVNKVKDL